MHTERLYTKLLSKKNLSFDHYFSVMSSILRLIKEIITDLLLVILVIPTFIRVINVIVMMSNFFKYLYRVLQIRCISIAISKSLVDVALVK